MSPPGVDNLTVRTRGALKKNSLTDRAVATAKLLPAVPLRMASAHDCGVGASHATTSCLASAMAHTVAA